MSDNPIKTLYHEDKNAWCQKYFPEYYNLWGKYPEFLPNDIVIPFEVTPWEGWDDGTGINPNGTILGTEEKEIVEDDGTTRIATRETYLDVPEDEYLFWCEQINWFRNGNLTPLGGPGLDPRVFLGATNSTTHPRQRLNCRSGTYYFTQPPDPKNEFFGVNSYFARNGRRLFSYVSDKYGPGNWNPVAYGGGGRDSDLPLPDLDEYNTQWWARTLMM